MDDIFWFCTLIFSSHRLAWTPLLTYSIDSFIYLPTFSTEVSYFINFNKTKICLIMIHISACGNKTCWLFSCYAHWKLGIRWCMWLVNTFQKINWYSFLLIHSWYQTLAPFCNSLEASKQVMEELVSHRLLVIRKETLSSMSWWLNPKCSADFD